MVEKCIEQSYLVSGIAFLPYFPSIETIETQHCCKLTERRAAAAGISVSWKAGADPGSLRAQARQLRSRLLGSPPPVSMAAYAEGSLSGPLLKLSP